jgi:hypothetical protein
VAVLHRLVYKPFLPMKTLTPLGSPRIVSQSSFSKQRPFRDQFPTHAVYWGGSDVITFHVGWTDDDPPVEIHWAATLIRFGLKDGVVYNYVYGPVGPEPAAEDWFATLTAQFAPGLNRAAFGESFNLWIRPACVFKGTDAEFQNWLDSFIES